MKTGDLDTHGKPGVGRVPPLALRARWALNIRALVTLVRAPAFSRRHCRDLDWSQADGRLTGGREALATLTIGGGPAPGPIELLIHVAGIIQVWPPATMTLRSVRWRMPRSTRPPPEEHDSISNRGWAARSSSSSR